MLEKIENFHERRFISPDSIGNGSVNCFQGFSYLIEQDRSARLSDAGRSERADLAMSCFIRTAELSRVDLVAVSSAPFVLIVRTS